MRRRGVRVEEIVNESVHRPRSREGLLTTWVGSKMSSSNGRGFLNPRGTALSGVGVCANADQFWSGLKPLLGNGRGIPVAWPADKRKDKQIKRSISRDTVTFGFSRKMQDLEDEVWHDRGHTNSGSKCGHRPGSTTAEISPRETRRTCGLGLQVSSTSRYHPPIRIRWRGSNFGSW